MSNLSSKIKAFATKIANHNDTLNRDLVSKVSGVTFEDRQSLLEKIDQYTEILLERDRHNKHDFYAIKVLAKISDAWCHIGFLPKNMARLVANSLDQGMKFKTSVHRRIGGPSVVDGTSSSLNYGLEIKIKR